MNESSSRGLLFRADPAGGEEGAGATPSTFHASLDAVYLLLRVEAVAAATPPDVATGVQQQEQQRQQHQQHEQQQQQQEGGGRESSFSSGGVARAVAAGVRLVAGRLGAALLYAEVLHFDTLAGLLIIKTDAQCMPLLLFALYKIDAVDGVPCRFSLQRSSAVLAALATPPVPRASLLLL